MEKFKIQGGSHVSGSIAVRGAKNHALKAIAAALLSDNIMRLRNIPEIEDVFRLVEILEKIGAKSDHKGHGNYDIDTSNVSTTDLPDDLVPQLRSSIVLTGPLLARFKSASLPHPGGCAIGRRPIDIFIAGYKAMGVEYEYKNSTHHFRAPDGLKGTRFIFPIVSVTGTETLMMAATLAEGTTTLVNAACEPEIKALADYLNAHGAKIKGAGTYEITIQGVESMGAGICEIIPDRIETLSFLFLALASKSQLEITDCDPSFIAGPIKLLQESGASIDINTNSIMVHPWKTLKPMKVVTGEYPGFPTDGQSPLTVLLTQIPGESEINETIYTDRLFYTDMLNRMGANITMHTPQHITIDGNTLLRAKSVESPDLRAGIAMIIAAIIAEGETDIGNIYQIDRGYEAIDSRLRSIGVKIKRYNA